MNSPTDRDASLRLTHRSEVTAEQIDHLGHMNVRYYGVNAEAGARALARELGVDPVGLALADSYTRFHAEQLEGARLEVHTGVLEVTDSGIRLYQELSNPDSGAIAATFVQRCSIEGHLPADTVDAATDRVIELPERGLPRSIDLDADPVGSAPDLGVVGDRGLAMRRPRRVSEEECDDDGDFVPSLVPMLTWGGEPIDQRNGPMLHEGPDGELMGFASMETRMAVARLPRLGDRIQAFGAEIDLRTKTSHRIQWAYDLDRGDLLCSFQVLNLAFDTRTRRSMEIPPAVRDRMSRDFHSDLAPR